MRPLLLLFLLSGTVLDAARLRPEADYTEAAGKKYQGETEVRMPDGTRCDVVTDRHAIEVEFADKWAEAIGQALFYGLQAEKKAGIILVLEDEKDSRYWIRLNSVVKHYDLPVDVLRLDVFPGGEDVGFLKGE